MVDNNPSTLNATGLLSERSSSYPAPSGNEEHQKANNFPEDIFRAAPSLRERLQASMVPQHQSYRRGSKGQPEGGVRQRRSHLETRSSPQIGKEALLGFQSRRQLSLDDCQGKYTMPPTAKGAKTWQNTQDTVKSGNGTLQKS